MRNIYPGVCYRCGEVVAAGEGHYELVPKKLRDMGLPKWKTQHADCAIRWRGQQPTREAALTVRKQGAR